MDAFLACETLVPSAAAMLIGQFEGNSNSNLSATTRIWPNFGHRFAASTDGIAIF
jgi:hypothetical protein